MQNAACRMQAKRERRGMVALPPEFCILNSELPASSTTSPPREPHVKPSLGRVRRTISTRYSPLTRDGRAVMTT